MATGIRVRDDAYEAKCDYCLDWWPLDAEFWDRYHGFRSCKACIRDRVARRMAERREDPVMRARDKAASDANRAAKLAADPGYTRRAQAEWYRRNAESERIKRRARYAEKKRAEGKEVRHYGPTPEMIQIANEIRRKESADRYARRIREEQAAAEGRIVKAYKPRPRRAA